MSVWLTIPSARPVEQVEPVLRKWKERGYKIALVRDYVSGDVRGVNILHVLGSQVEYPGYAVSTNKIISEVLASDPTCDWVVIGGDDVEPDANHSAEAIAQQCCEHFAEVHYTREALERRMYSTVPLGPRETFGVMQPTGDRWGENERHMGNLGSAYVDRVCGSAWLGREFCQRINGGRGPLWPEYFHMYVDEALYEVASRLGILWQRRDLIHLHNHWARPRGLASDMPPHLVGDIRKSMAYGREIFERQKAEGFAKYMELK